MALTKGHAPRCRWHNLVGRGSILNIVLHTQTQDTSRPQCNCGVERHLNTYNFVSSLVLLGTGNNYGMGVRHIRGGIEFFGVLGEWSFITERGVGKLGRQVEFFSHQKRVVEVFLLNSQFPEGGCSFFLLERHLLSTNL